MAELFRKKTLDRISAPEQLDSYIRVANPSVWLVYAAIIVLLLGIIVWSCTSRLETKLLLAGSSENGRLTCYVKDTDYESVKAAGEIRVGEARYPIEAKSPSPQKASDINDEYLLYLGGIEPGEWVYALTASTDLEDGRYRAEIVTDTMRPISFVLN